MITGFEEETQPLSEYETDVLLPVLIKGLRKKFGKSRAVTNKHIVSQLKAKYKITDVRVRKIINHIRIKDLLPGLIATSDGYFIAESKEELLSYEESLKGREDAIRAVRQSIIRQRKILYPDGQQGNLF